MEQFTALQKLQYKSLQVKVGKELENHLGFNDKEISEFIINLARDAGDATKFQTSLKDNEVELDPVVSRNLYFIIDSQYPRMKSETKIIKEQPKVQSIVETSVHKDSKIDENSSNFNNEINKNSHSYRDNHEDRRSDYHHHHEDRSSSRDHYHHTHSHSHSHSISDSHSRNHFRDYKQSSNSDYQSEDYHNSHHGSRRDESNYHSRERSNDRNQSNTIEQFHIYTGKVKNIMNYGIFIDLFGVYPKKEGLCHISQISNTFLNNPADVIHKDQIVKVKVLSIAGNKVSLSMKEVDQETGEDLNPARATSALIDASTIQNQQIVSNVPTGRNTRGSRKRMTSRERYELQQLIASGVLNIKDYPELNEDIEILKDEAEDAPEEDIDVEVNTQIAPFLDHTELEEAAVEPTKIVRNPEGSMVRGAVNASALAKERRELRRQQQEETLDRPVDLDQQWADPLYGDDHLLAAELKTINKSHIQLEEPEWKKSSRNAVIFGQGSSMDIQERRRSLPIYQFKNQFLEAVSTNNVLLVIGETGSGKTTQMTQYLVEAGYSRRGMIGCTQPRRVAATSIAKRVAEEYGCQLGEEVGYSVRFDDVVSNKTIIKYMTDGMLMREYLIDPTLSRYSFIILDEAHERTVNTDVLFTLLKRLVIKRKDMKLIVTSATLDSEKFSTYFYNCPIFRIPGRTFPVQVNYLSDPTNDYLSACLETVISIHTEEPQGDILVFLTGQEEIDTACDKLDEYMKTLGDSVPKLHIYPAYAALPDEMQNEIFLPPPAGERKVVIATNLAEASLTIDGIYYVIDSGYCKLNVYNPKTRMSSLQVVPISQASAAQRSGRAGRTGPGTCYRMYTEQAYYNEMLPTTVPEIQRSNLENVALQLKAMGINDVLGLDLMDPPAPQALVSALEHLYALGCLNDNGLLTTLGRRMAEFPLDPPLSKVLLASCEHHCSKEVVTIVAMLSVENIFTRPRDKQTEADQKHAMFFESQGDHFTLLNVFESWIKNGKNPNWAKSNFLQNRSIDRANSVRDQLINIMAKYKLDITSSGRDYETIQKCIISGFFTQVAKKDPEEGYKTLINERPVYIHPSSAVFSRPPEWILYHDVKMTTKEYMRNVMAIDPKWLIEAAPKFFKKGDPNVLTDKKRNQKLVPLYDPRDPTQMWKRRKF